MKLLKIILSLLMAQNVWAASATFTADTTAEIANPERGMSILWSNLSDLTSTYLSTQVASGYRLITHRQNLSIYYATPTLPQTLLDKLTAGAALHRSAGTKMIMQFSYDNTGCFCTEPTRAIMLGHIAQLSSFFKNNADVIAYVHAGFLGTYGEWAIWHVSGDSLNGAPTQNMEDAVRDALYAAVDKRTPIQFRRINLLKRWYPTALTAAGAFTGSNQSRSSFHNDCWLHTYATDIGKNLDNDAGTYWNSGANYGRLNNTYRDYHAAISQFISTGGENCGDAETSARAIVAGFPDYTTVCGALQYDGARYGWNNLRTDWGSVWSILSIDGCQAAVKRNLGYRLQLDAISHADSVTHGSTATFSVKLRDLGWGRTNPGSERRLMIRLVKSGATDITGQSNAQLRLLRAQATGSTTITVSVSVPSGATLGSYSIYIEAPDSWSSISASRKYKIKFANANSGGQVWDDTNGRFATGTTITVN
jgi:hypothetical protein